MGTNGLNKMLLQSKEMISRKAKEQQVATNSNSLEEIKDFLTSDSVNLAEDLHR